jgi:hypothetical protein
MQHSDATEASHFAAPMHGKTNEKGRPKAAFASR